MNISEKMCTRTMEFSSTFKHSKNKINLQRAKFYSLTAKLGLGYCTVFLIIFICASYFSHPQNPICNRFCDNIRITRDFPHPHLCGGPSVWVCMWEEETKKGKKRGRRTGITKLYFIYILLIFLFLPMLLRKLHSYIRNKSIHDIESKQRITNFIKIS